MTRISSWIFAATLLCVPSSFAIGRSVTLNGSAIVKGDLLVLGTLGLQINGTPNFGGVIVGTDRATPSNYKVTLNGSVSVGHLRIRTHAITLPVHLGKAFSKKIQKSLARKTCNPVFVHAA